MRWWKNKSRRWRQAAVAALAGLLLLASAGVSAWEFWPAPVPDFNTASSREIADYLAHGNFGKLSTARRRALMRLLAERYLKLNADAQKDLNALCKKAGVPSYLMHEMWNAYGVTLARELADHYASLTPQDRQAFLDSTYWFFTASPNLKKEGDKWFSGQSIAKSFGQSAGNVQTAIVNFQQLVNGSTTATERSTINEITAGLSQRWQKAQQQ